MPIVVLPVVGCLVIAERRAKRQGKLIGLKTLKEMHDGYPTFLVYLFWKLDVIGLLLFSVFLSLLLVPLTIAGGVSSSWSHGDIIAMLVVGPIIFPVFVLWEAKYARHPMMPFHLMKDRSM